MPKPHTGAPNASIFIKNLPYDASDEDLRHIFVKYGRLRDVYIPLDYYTKEPRGFAYIQYEDVRDAETAVAEIRGIQMKGRELEVRFAEGERKKPGQMRGKEIMPKRNGSGEQRNHEPTRSHYRSSPPMRRHVSLSPERRTRNRSPMLMPQSPNRRPVLRRDASPRPRQRGRSPSRRNMIGERSMEQRDRSPLRRQNSPPLRRKRPSPALRNGRMREQHREELIAPARGRSMSPTRRTRKGSPVLNQRMGRYRNHGPENEHFDEITHRPTKPRERSPLLSEREMRELSPPRKRPIRRSPDAGALGRKRGVDGGSMNERRIPNDFQQQRTRRMMNRRGDEDEHVNERHKARRMTGPEKSRYSQESIDDEPMNDPQLKGRSHLRSCSPIRQSPPRSSRRPNYSPNGQQRSDVPSQSRRRPDFSPQGQRRSDISPPMQRRPDFSPKGQRRPDFSPQGQRRVSPRLRRRPMALLDTPPLEPRKPQRSPDRSMGSRPRQSRSGRPRTERRRNDKHNDANMDDEYEFVDEEVYEELDAMDDLDIELNDFS